MQANVAAHQMRYEVDYRGECEGNPMSGLWWRMVEKIQKKTGLKTTSGSLIRLTKVFSF